ncbi:hypothetical protein BJ165DRAFT_1591732 [Panaeolus papilionaceus]|nr:hypothetical protein BJ165DRAFT_1591732 [Panaeolus papilionaceus]
MSNSWDASHTDHHKDITIIERFYRGHSDELVQLPRDGSINANNSWGTFLPVPSVDPLMAIDVNAPIVPHEFSTLTQNTLFWDFPTFISPDITKDPQPTVVLPHGSFDWAVEDTQTRERQQILNLVATSDPAPPSAKLHSRVANVDYRGSQSREYRSPVAHDDPYLKASQKIVEIMTSFKVMSEGDTARMGAEIAHASNTLNTYLLSLSQDVYRWIENKRWSRVGVPSARSHSAARRRHVNLKGLYLCLWCDETLTTKNNFANHIRAHLNLHMSFCNYCEFSSVATKLPIRHKCRRLNGDGQSAEDIETGIGLRV